MTDHPSIPSPEAFGMGEQGKGFVYVRSVAKADLDPEIETPDGVETFYALHDAGGRRIALFDDRDLAFAVAKSNDLHAVSVH